MNNLADQLSAILLKDEQVLLNKTGRAPNQKPRWPITTTRDKHGDNDVFLARANNPFGHSTKWKYKWVIASRRLRPVTRYCPAKAWNLKTKNRNQNLHNFILSIRWRSDATDAGTVWVCHANLFASTFFSLVTSKHNNSVNVHDVIHLITDLHLTSPLAIVPLRSNDLRHVSRDCHLHVPRSIMGPLWTSFSDQKKERHFLLAVSEMVLLFVSRQLVLALLLASLRNKIKVKLMVLVGLKTNTMNWKVYESREQSLTISVDFKDASLISD